jgi:hypothetical protein
LGAREERLHQRGPDQQAGYDIWSPHQKIDKEHQEKDGRGSDCYRYDSERNRPDHGG